jgi:hypothetical protein
LWTRHLCLDGYKVVHERYDTPQDPVHLTLLSTATIALCPDCERPTAFVHRRLDSEAIRDLPHGPQSVTLILRSCPFHWEPCGRYFTPACPHVAPGAHAIERFLEQAAKRIRFSDIANAAAFLGVPEKTLERWYYDYAERKTKAPTATTLQPITSLGIDELSLKTTSAN